MENIDCFLKARHKDISFRDLLTMRKAGLNIQRAFVLESGNEEIEWDLKTKQNFISNFLRGISSGNLFFEYDKEKNYYQVIDGVQRIKTLFSFIQDEFINEKGQFYSALLKEDGRYLENIRNFGKPVLSISIYERLTSEERVELFERVNIISIKENSS